MHESVIAFVEQVLAAGDVADKTVLEVGSYDVNGSVRPYVESLGPARYLGVDGQAGPRVDLVADCLDLTATVGCDWDVVISTEMLEHVRDWQPCVCELAAAVAPGGLLLITTRSPGFPYHPYPEDHWRYSTDVMAQILDGLALAAIIEDDPQVPGVFVLARKPPDWPGTDVGRLIGIAVEPVYG